LNQLLQREKRERREKWFSLWFTFIAESKSRKKVIQQKGRENINEKKRERIINE
jgi:hypothetical protein